MENEVFCPGILFGIAGYDSGDCLQIGFFKLRLDDFGDFLRAVAVDIVHSFLQCVGKWLDDFRIFFQIRTFGTEGGVRYIAGIGTERSDNIAIPFRFERGGMWLKFNSESFLLRQIFQKWKPANTACLLIDFDAAYDTFPECLSVGFVKL